jgi:hypothetical protein
MDKDPIATWTGPCPHCGGDLDVTAYLERGKPTETHD